MYQFARTAIISQHRLSNVNNRNLFSHSFGSQESEMKMQAVLISSEDCFSCIGGCFFPLCLPWVFHLCVSVLISFLYKDTSLIFKIIFQGHTCDIIEVPGLGVKSVLQLWAYTTVWQHQIPAASVTTARHNMGSDP